MININFSGIKNSFGSISLFNLNFNGRKSTQKKEKKNFDFGKLNLISPFADFGSLPHFEVKNATMEKTLIESFYNAAIKLTYDFDFTETQFEFFKKNFCAYNIKTKLELIEYLIRERDFSKRNDSRYYLGFRSIYVVLKNNLEKVSYDYIIELNKILSPFFVSFKHKELLTPGVSYIEK